MNSDFPTGIIDARHFQRTTGVPVAKPDTTVSSCIFTALLRLELASRLWTHTDRPTRQVGENTGPEGNLMPALMGHRAVEGPR
jgi:hypothetical protein